MIGHIDKWGNSLGVRIPSKIAASLMLKAGSDVELVLEADQLIIKPLGRRSLKDLLADYPKEGIDDIADGPERGRERTTW
jgi:antitoxin MazE